jgi:hypothetical protein
LAGETMEQEAAVAVCSTVFLCPRIGLLVWLPGKLSLF